MAFSVVGHRNEPGRRVAHVLAGSWRADVTPVDMSPQDLERIAPILMRTQEAGLACRRLRGTPHEETLLGQQLQASFRHVRLRNAVIEGHVPALVERLQQAGVEPIVIKGWSVARQYPERGLRPYGDVDLCIRRHEEAAATKALEGAGGVAIDLHVDLTNEQGVRLLEHDAEAVFARSRRVPLGNSDVRVLCPEDHLRLICLHMLRHGAFRPLWFCDIAVNLESLPRNFDWDLCLGLDQQRSDWVMFAVELTRRLLGAEDASGTFRGCRLPGWFEDAVLRQWTEFGEAPPRRLATYLHDPRGIYHKIRYRWMNPLWAVQHWQGPLRNLPRWSYQLREFFVPGTRLIRHIPDIELAEIR